MNRKGKKWIIIIIILVCMAVLGVFSLNKLRGHGYFSAVKNYVKYLMERPDFDEYEPLEEEEEAWYSNHEFIAHAMAGIDGIDYTNSREAFENAFENGYRVYEVDFSVTSDGKVVCSHDFEEFDNVIPDYDKFMKSKINGLYTPLDLSQVIELLVEHEEIYLMTDFKWDNSFGSDNKDVEVIMQELISVVESYQDTTLFDRIIIQVYSEENYYMVAGYQRFTNYVYTLYQYAYPIYEKIAAFCLENRIPVVTMGMERATKENVELFCKWNIKVYSHTVNSTEEARQQFENGVSGIYTDWILPVEMERMR